MCASRLSSASTFSSLTLATKLSKPRQASTFLAIRASSVLAAQCGYNPGELHGHAQYKFPISALPFTPPRFLTLQSFFPVDEDD